MPELPEVETIRRDLSTRVVDKKIIALDARDHKVADKNLAKILVGKKFIKIERRGKLLAFLLSDGQYLLAHLKMTGQLIYKEKRTRSKEKIVAGGHKISPSDLQVPNNFTRVIFSFVDKSQLFFNDMRRFGYLKLASADEKEKIFNENFGIEPLTENFKFKNFSALFARRKTNLKALLMNQKLIAGIGNIYADEACYCAGLLPWRKAGSLTAGELKRLFSSITEVLKVALKNRGTSFDDFVDAQGEKGGHYNFLNVYERDGEKCRRCKSIIKKTRHAGRGTHFCLKCQK
ncbi:MAG: bifunctional DNA-formamidopyrimidine glycosylase/DNA-(apurinic or apyrimidinic site) lyase [Candidatus Magasanikbacteria bacterium]|jgi:formamidopyrimidine-DNA glycosylase